MRNNHNNVAFILLALLVSCTSIEPEMTIEVDSDVITTGVAMDVFYTAATISGSFNLVKEDTLGCSFGFLY